MSRILGVDVDLTVCPSDLGWIDWLYERASEEDQKKFLGMDKTILPYSLGDLFPSVDNHLEYWRNLDYFQFQPLKGSVETLKLLNEGCDIVFISAIKGNHNKSKYYWLKEYFPFLKGYIATKEKFILNDSVIAMIDDRNAQLSGFDFSKRIKFKTCYEQDKECYLRSTFNDWEKFDIQRFIKEYL